MGAVAYAFCMTVVVLVVAWAIYVLPTPGPLPPLSLAAGLIPAVSIIGMVMLTVMALWAAAFVLRAAVRLAFRPRR